MNTEQESMRISEQDVMRFLQQNPDFFATHPQLLADLRLHHESGKAISLIERQVAVLRDQKKQLKNQLQDLVQIARANDNLDQRLHQLTLALIGIHRWDEAIHCICEYLQRDFNIQCVAIRLQPLLDGHLELLRLREFITDADENFQSFSALINEGKPVCGRFKAEQVSYLFGEGSECIASVALVPLRDLPTIHGMLALGSQDAQRFHAAQGTAFLMQLGELISRVLRGCLSACEGKV